MKRLVHLASNWRIILVLVLLVASFFWIHPYFDRHGAMVVSVREPAALYGISPRDIVTNINGHDVGSVSDFVSVVSGLNVSDDVSVSLKREVFPYVYSDFSERYYPVLSRNQTSLGLSVIDVPETNLDFGLEIVGGTMVLLKPEEVLSEEEIDNVIAILEQRLNIFGLREIPISYVQDFSGNQYFRLEFPGTGPEEAEELLEREGSFEARVGNYTVFTGKDIVSVCIGGTGCFAQVAPRQSEQGMFWEFMFEIFITGDAAERFANVTSGMSVEECTPSGCYLNGTIAFYIDGEQVGNELRISSNLQGKVITNPSITGSRESRVDAQEEMKTFQAILRSGEMPVGMGIERVEVISPRLGEEFAQNIFVVFLIAIIGVEAIIWLRYRDPKVILPIMFITLSEIFITLGIASAMRWTLDLAGIAGLIAAVGTGLDDQIIMTDEVISGNVEKSGSVKNRLKKAFFIIITAFASTIATMVPLAMAGAGILRGFAITTIIATSVGIFVTRPAYARIMELLMRD